MRKLGERLLDFLFPTVSDTWLIILRCGLGLQIITYCLSVRTDWVSLYAVNGSGLISRDLAEALLSSDSALVPRLGWLITGGEHLGLKEATTLNSLWWLLFGGGFCLLVGFFCRWSAVATWFLFLCAVKSGAFSSYGMDNFTTIGLFYLMLTPLPDRLSFDATVRHLKSKSPQLHGFFRRVLQLHLCVIYFFGGLTKACGPAWWNGESLWRALTRVPFNVISPEFLAAWGHLLPLLGIGVCLLEIGYPIFIWPKTTRAFWLGGILGMHLAIAFTMGLFLFSLIMIVLNLAAFATDLDMIVNYTRRRRANFTT